MHDPDFAGKRKKPVSQASTQRPIGLLMGRGFATAL